MRHTTRGNILFLILLAVVLFAALAYAVTSSMRGGGKSASDENAEAKVSETMNYFTQLDGAVQRMLVTGGIRDYELSFYYLTGWNFVGGAYDNTNCTSSACRVFDPAGGGVAGKKMNRFSKSSANSQERLFYIKIPGVGTDKRDIVYGFHGVSAKICAAINQKIGVNGILYNTSAVFDSISTPYQNTIPLGAIDDTGTAAINVPVNVGQAGTFCYCRSAQNSGRCDEDSEAWPHDPTVIHVLVAR